MNKEFFIIAGEASGDMHASSLVSEIKKLAPDSVFRGIGGGKMRSAGVDTALDINDVNFIGFTSVLKNIFTIKKHLKETSDMIIRSNPAAVILVDFPGFNLRIAQRIRKAYSGKIIYYISPQVWAWHKSRIKIMKEVLDLLIVVFPFETEFFSKEGMRSIYVGHPLVKRIDGFMRSNRRSPNEKPVISILSGSRKSEVDAMLPVMLDSARELRKRFDCRINVICAQHLPAEVYRRHTGDMNVSLVHGNDSTDANYSAILNSDLVLTKSGTSTLECALLGVPFLVVYKTGTLNYMIGKRLVEVNHIAIVNILLDKPAVKEFLQNEMTVENIVSESEKILSDKPYRERMLSEFAELRKILGPGDASREAALQICSVTGITTTA